MNSVAEGRPAHVAVVGGGPAGLAAAARLLEAGRRVTLFEAGAAPGGLLRTDELGGALLDPAVQLVADSYTRFLDLVRRTGAGALLVRAPGKDALWRGGRIHPITYGSMVSMSASGALPVTLKLRLAARYLPFLKRHAAGLDANDPLGTGGARHDSVSVAAWGAEHVGGGDFAELLAYPLLGAYYGATPEETGAAFYHGLAREGMDVRVYGARGGMGALAAAVVAALVARGLEVRSGVAVRRVRPEGQGARVEADGGAAGGERFDGVVVAVPAPVAARLLGADGALGEWLAAVRTRSSAAVGLVLDRPARVDWFGLSFPRASTPGRALVAATVQGNKAGLEGSTALVLMPAPARAEELAAALPEAAVEALLGPLEVALPGVRRRVVRARHYTFPNGYTLFPPGYVAHLARFRDDWLPAGVALAGGYRVAPTVEGAVRSGERAAERLLEG